MMLLGILTAFSINPDTDVESFGFGSNEELMETEISAKKFFEKLGSEFSLRKANSTKTNKPKDRFYEESTRINYKRNKPRFG